MRHVALAINAFDHISDDVSVRTTL